MVWFVIKNDKNMYITKAKNGKITTSPNKNSAFKYPSLSKANNVLKNLPRTLRGGHVWTTEEVEGRCDTVKSDRSIVGVVKSEGIDDVIETFEEFKAKMNSSLDFISKYEEMIEDELKKVDMKINALEHFAENFNCSASEACVKWKMLEKLRRERRPIKRKYLLARSMREQSQELLKNFEIMVHESNWDNYIYEPKALAEIFEEKLKRLESRKRN